MRVLFPTSAGLGHIHPTVPLAQALVARGNDVLWAVPPDGVDHVQRSGILAAAVGSAGLTQPADVRRRYPPSRKCAFRKAPTSSSTPPRPLQRAPASRSFPTRRRRRPSAKLPSACSPISPSPKLPGTSVTRSRRCPRPTTSQLSSRRCHRDRTALNAPPEVFGGQDSARCPPYRPVVSRMARSGGCDRPARPVSRGRRGSTW